MNSRNRLITLLTDFGAADWFAGTLKGVILGLQPRAAIIDLTHEVPPGDVRAAAFALAAACRFFERGTIHLAVVDPGVGGPRPAIVVETRDYFFVGPDNGVLSLALQRESVRRIHRLENSKYFRPTISQTFHGRDIFAPVAAHLSRGVSCHRFGRKQENYCELPWPEVRLRPDGFEGEIVYVDRFGNAISNLGNELLEQTSNNWAVRLRHSRLCPVRPFYQAVPTGKPVAVPGSSGFLEISRNGGNAARAFGLKIGMKIRLVSLSD